MQETNEMMKIVYIQCNAIFVVNRHIHATAIYHHLIVSLWMAHLTLVFHHSDCWCFWLLHCVHWFWKQKYFKYLNAAVQKCSYGTIRQTTQSLIMLVLCSGIPGAGYIKLHNDVRLQTLPGALFSGEVLLCQWSVVICSLMLEFSEAWIDNWC